LRGYRCPCADSGGGDYGGGLQTPLELRRCVTGLCDEDPGVRVNAPGGGTHSVPVQLERSCTESPGAERFAWIGGDAGLVHASKIAGETGYVHE